MVVRAWPAGHLLKDRIEPFVTTFLNGPGRSTPCRAHISVLAISHDFGKETKLVKQCDLRKI